MKGLAMLKAKIYVQLKANVLDPQGKAVTNSLHNLGYTDVIETRISEKNVLHWSVSPRGKQMLDEILSGQE